MFTSQNRIANKKNLDSLQVLSNLYVSKSVVFVHNILHLHLLFGVLALASKYIGAEEVLRISLSSPFAFPWSEFSAHPGEAVVVPVVTLEV